MVVNSGQQFDGTAAPSFVDRIIHNEYTNALIRSEWLCLLNDTNGQGQQEFTSRESRAVEEAIDVPVFMLEDEQKKGLKQRETRESESLRNPCLSKVLSNMYPCKRDLKGEWELFCSELIRYHQYGTPFGRFLLAN